MSRNKEGDLIVKSEPWSYCVKIEHSDQYCYRCMAKAPAGSAVRRCSVCKFAHYCSEKCQRADWKERHKPPCGVIKDVLEDLPRHTISMNVFLETAHAVLKLKRGELTQAPGTCQPPTSRSFYDLVSHETELEEDTKVQAHYRHFKPYFVRIDPSSCDTFSKFLGIHGRLRINSFSLVDGPVNTGMSLDLGRSSFNHSCDPNAVARCVEGINGVVKALRNIHPGEEVTISYIDVRRVLAVPEVRQRHLMNNYFFQCGCPPCTDKSVDALRNAVSCQTAGCEAVIPMDDTADPKCSACGADNTNQIRMGQVELEEVARRLQLIDLVPHMTDADRAEVLMTDIQLAEKYLHPSNLLLGILYKEISEALRGDDLDHAATFAKKALLPVSRHLGKHESGYTDALADVVDALVGKERYKEALPYAEETLKLKAVFPGKETPFYEAYRTQCAFLASAARRRR